MKISANNILNLPMLKLNYLKENPDAVIKRSFSPKTLCQHFNVYENGRKDGTPILSMLYDVLDSICNLRGLKVIKNKQNDILAGFTYKFRKNKYEETSMYVDSIARNKKNDLDLVSKKLMSKLYQDIKNTAKSHDAKEITLFVYAREKNLKANYERLGFKIDNKCDVKKLYLMRVPIDKFLNNMYFKCRLFKEACGVDSILRKNKK